MSFSSNWLNGVNHIFEWIYRLAYINFLWILFTLIGGVVFGITPATVAMFAVVRQWLKGKSNQSTLKSFFTIYKNDFRKANTLGLLLVFVGLVLYIDAKLIVNFTGFFKYILLGSFGMVFSFYVLILLYVFPVFVQYKNNSFQHIKSALLIGIAYPLRTIVMGISVISVLFICFVFPVLSFLYLGSGLSIVLMFFSRHLFTKISEEKVAIIS